jgi:hypothetical protein
MSDRLHVFERRPKYSADLLCLRKKAARHYGVLGSDTWSKSWILSRLANPEIAHEMLVRDRQGVGFSELVQTFKDARSTSANFPSIFRDDFVEWFDRLLPADSDLAVADQAPDSIRRTERCRDPDAVAAAGDAVRAAVGGLRRRDLKTCVDIAHLLFAAYAAVTDTLIGHAIFTGVDDVNWGEIMRVKCEKENKARGSGLRQVEVRLGGARRRTRAAMESDD